MKDWFKKYSWEYWPSWLMYLPIVPLILYFAFRSGRMWFFSNVNPAIKNSGLMGASKFAINNLLPSGLIPKTVLLTKGSHRLQHAAHGMNGLGIQFPIIVKPDIGERGRLVELIDNTEHLDTYLKCNPVDILIQEFIKYPNECGIFFVKFPHSDKLKILSVGLKKFLSVEGDGIKTLRELMEQDVRSIKQWKRLQYTYHMDQIVPFGEVIDLEPIGNHSRGTQFVDGSHLIDSVLHDTLSQIVSNLDGINYGRFDIRYDTWEGLLKLENMSILELNGVASEPIHVYDPTIHIIDKYRSLCDVWSAAYQLSQQQLMRGIEPTAFWAGLRELFRYKRELKRLNPQWRKLYIKDA